MTTAPSQNDFPPSVANLPPVFAKAYPTLGLSGIFKRFNEDFIVNEYLGFEPAGDGEHVLIFIEKEGQNTHWVVQQLADALGFDRRDIGYCGRKDRHARTRQWLSIYDPHRRLDVAYGKENGKSEQLDKLATIEGVKLLQSARHTRKLRPGDHGSNCFCIRLRDVRYAQDGEPRVLLDAEKTSVLEALDARLQQGVPNYFGAQRFGRNGSNLQAAKLWFEHKKAPAKSHKPMVMSAARAYLFNRVLAERINSACWQTMIDGDIEAAHQQQTPTAPLWGRGRLPTSGKAQALELKALEALQTWCHGLEHRGLSQERRSTVLAPSNIALHFEADDLILAFELPAGTFATAVLAEVAVLCDGV